VLLTINLYLCQHSEHPTPSMLQIFRYYFRLLPRPLQNKYILTALVFGIWVLFFDRNNIWSQRKLQTTLREMDVEKKYFEGEMKKVEQQKLQLFSNPRSLEKYARETYQMKKDDEDIFVIVEQ
jgi:cell division protein DivIC